MGLGTTQYYTVLHRTHRYCYCSSTVLLTEMLAHHMHTCVHRTLIVHIIHVHFMFHIIQVYMEASRIRFMLGATYDVLPSPQN